MIPSLSFPRPLLILDGVEVAHHDAAFSLHWGSSARHNHHHQYHRHCVWHGFVSNYQDQQKHYENHQDHQRNQGIFISIMIVKVLFDTAPFQSWTRCKAGQPPLQSVNIDHRHDHHHCLINIITILITGVLNIYQVHISLSGMFELGSSSLCPPSSPSSSQRLIR